MAGDCKTQERCCRREGFPEEGRLSVERGQTRMKRDCDRLAERRSGWDGKGGHETAVRTVTSGGAVAGRAGRLHRLSTKGDRAGGEDGVPGAVTGQVKMGVQGHKQSGSPRGMTCAHIGEGHTPVSLVPQRKAGRRSKPPLKVLD